VGAPMRLRPFSSAVAGNIRLASSCRMPRA
jgi:hypothetical protein